LEFVASYCSDDLSRRKETDRFRRFSYADIIARDKANIDIQWAPNAVNPLEGQTPHALMKEILNDLEEAMREFAAAEAEIR
jgi:type I restriction enzyme M protein